MKKKSFTLIELLVVIAIIGILSSLVIARFSNWNNESRIANTLQWSSGAYRKLGANLIGHWPLNGDLNDISGYGNHGILGNGSCNPGEGTCPNWAEGVLGGANTALEFDGSSYATTTKNFDYSKNFTASIWAKRKVRDLWQNAIQFATFYPHLISIHNNNNIAGGYLKQDTSPSIVYCP